MRGVMRRSRKPRIRGVIVAAALLMIGTVLSAVYAQDVPIPKVAVGKLVQINHFH